MIVATGCILIAVGTGGRIIPGAGHRSITAAGSAIIGSAGAGCRTGFGDLPGCAGDTTMAIAAGHPCLRAHTSRPAWALHSMVITRIIPKTLDWVRRSIALLLGIIFTIMVSSIIVCPTRRMMSSSATPWLLLGLPARTAGFLKTDCPRRKLLRPPTPKCGVSPCATRQTRRMLAESPNCSMPIAGR